MIRKLGYIFAGLVIAIALFAAFGYVVAGPKECPPGQDEGCSTYHHKETGKEACFPDNANPQGWIFVKSGCDSEKKEEKDPPTSTPVPVIFPTSTVVVVFPTATLEPGNKITLIPTKWGNNSNPKTPTPTLVALMENESCANSCMCLIVTQLAVANDLQRTQIANDVRSCTQP